MTAMNISRGLYDLGNFSTSNTLFEVVKTTNELTDQSLMMGIIIVGWAVLFVSMKSYQTNNTDAGMASTFIAIVLTLMLASINFVPLYFTVFIVLVGGILMVKISKNPS